MDNIVIWLVGAIIFGILGTFFFFVSLATCLDNEKKAEIEINISTFFLVGCIAIVLFVFVAECMLNTKNYKYEDTPYSTQYIVALNDNNIIHGRFYLRRGYIDEEMYYQYLMKWNGGYKLNQIEASNATIYESDNDYRVEWYEGKRNWLCFTDTTKIQKIYVPNGSIKESFNIDLE